MDYKLYQQTDLFSELFMSAKEAEETIRSLCLDRQPSHPCYADLQEALRESESLCRLLEKGKNISDEIDL